MSTIIRQDDKKATVNKIVNQYAGCLSELHRQFKANNMRYVKVNRGFRTVYIVRGEGIQDKITVTL